MDRDLLSHLPVILSVARRGGFAAAAGELGMSASAVSHAVRLVEDRLGVPLFVRTTRSVRLSESGDAFLARIGPAIDDLAAAAETLQETRGKVTGLLRLNVPHVAFTLAIRPVLVRLAETHPDLMIEVKADNGLADIVAEGFDAGVRIGPGIAQDMVAVPLTGPMDTILVASAEYLRANGTPETIEDLHRHNCISYRMVTSGRIYKWELAEGGDEVEVPVKGTVIVSELLHAIDLARNGVGIAYAFEPVVRDLVASGALVEVLPETSVTEDPLHLYYPRRASMAPKLRAFIDAARAIRTGRTGAP